MIQHGLSTSRAVEWLTSLLLVFAAVPVADADNIRMNYLLNCEGCHKADGSGQPGYVPDFRGSVARFLAIATGRSYLGRVPGTSQSLLSDPDRAAVLNWILVTFDPEHVPADFNPYSAAEMAIYRRDPISQADTERRSLLRRMNDRSTDPVVPPPEFAICSACHPTSSDGASAMGPNLRGVVGRRAGTLGGFSYSAAMKSSGIIWTTEALDAFLEDVQREVPGTMMPLAGVPGAGDRASVIAYLKSLR